MKRDAQRVEQFYRWIGVSPGLLACTSAMLAPDFASAGASGRRDEFGVNTRYDAAIPTPEVWAAFGVDINPFWFPRTPRARAIVEEAHAGHPLRWVELEDCRPWLPVTPRPQALEAGRGVG